MSLITVQVVLAFRDQRLANGVSPQTINMDVNTLSFMLNWAVKYRIIGHNPFYDDGRG
ncbi:MAG: hypothetical protein ACYTG0_47190 [Planctomycetota bacterium]